MSLKHCAGSMQPNQMVPALQRGLRQSWKGPRRWQVLVSNSWGMVQRIAKRMDRGKGRGCQRPSLRCCLSWSSEGWGPSPGCIKLIELFSKVFNISSLFSGKPGDREDSNNQPFLRVWRIGAGIEPVWFLGCLFWICLRPSSVLGQSEVNLYKWLLQLGCRRKMLNSPRSVFELRG